MTTFVNYILIFMFPKDSLGAVLGRLDEADWDG
jgi:hypothetical protein